MVLVALGLSLGAAIITSVFLTGDTVQTAIHLQVVEGLGSVDEILHDQSGPYVPGDVDLTNLSGLDTGAPRLDQRRRVPRSAERAADHPGRSAA